MCGIAGIYRFGGANPDDAAAVNRMTTAVSHRGGTAQSVQGVGDCVFGHARLEIVGGDTAAQPLHLDGVVLTFNGEIYNYIDLRTDLINRGRRFSTRGDAEVIVNAYRVYGSAFIHKLQGVFAFALYDVADNKLCLCRDHMGVKPLYYAVTSDVVAFASEAKALHQLLPNNKINANALCEYLHFQYVLGSHTLFDNINKVLPGHIVTIRPKNLSSDRYWRLSCDSLRGDHTQLYTEKYYENKLLSILHGVARKQTPATVPFAVYVSGGLDSSTVAALMHEYRQDFKLISGYYDYSGCNEMPYVDELVKKLKMDKQLHAFNITQDDVADTIEDAIYYMDEPCAGHGLVGQFVLAKKLRQNFPDIKIVVGGQGGDELFGGYSRYIVAYLESCIQGAIYPSNKDYVLNLEKVSRLLPILQGYEPMLKSFLSKGVFEPREKRYFDLIRRLGASNFNPDFYSGCYSGYEKQMLDKFMGLFSESGQISYMARMMYFDLMVSLPALLHVDDRVNSAFALESRVPLLDDDVVEFAFSIPPPYKLSGGFSKGILRNVTAGILPESVRMRRDKMGFPVPMQQWLDEGGKFKDLVMTYVNADICKEVFGELKDVDNIKFDRGLWGRISLGIWSKKFNINI